MATMTEAPSGQGGAGTPVVETVRVGGYTPRVEPGGTGGPEERRTYTRHGQEQVTKPPEFPVARMTNHLKKDLNRWIRLEQTLPEDQFRTLLNQERNRYYAPLFDSLTKQKDGTDLREIDDAALTEYMKHDKARIDVYEIERRKAQSQELAMGMLSAMNIASPEPGTVEASDMTTGHGNALNQLTRRLHVFFSERYGDVYGRPNANLGTKGDVTRMLAQLTAGTTLFGAAVGGPAGAAVGAALPPAVALVVNQFKAGERVTMAQCLEAWKATSADPAATAFNREFLGIDPSDLEPDGAVGIRLKQGITLGTRIDAKSLGDDFLSLERDLKDCQTSMGVPREQQAPVGNDVRWLITGEGQPTQKGTDLESRVIPRMRGQLLDLAGNSREIEVPVGSGNWERNPAFNGNNVDGIGNVQRWEREVARALHGDVEHTLRAIVDRKSTNREDVMGEIDRKIAERRTGEVAERRRRQIDEEAGADGNGGRLAADRNFLTAQVGLLATYEQATQSLGELRRSRGQEAGRVTMIPAGGGAPVPVADIESEIGRIIDIDVPAAGTSRDPIRLGTRSIAPIYERQEALNTRIITQVEAYRTRYTPTVPLDPGPGASRTQREAYAQEVASYNQRVAALEAATLDRERTLKESEPYKSLQERINSDVTDLYGVLGNLDRLDEEIGVAQAALADRDNPTRQNIERVIGGMQEARRNVLGWHGVIAGADLDLAALRVQPIEVLVARINQVYDADPTAIPPRGWPRTENGSERNRQMLLQAKAESLIITTVPFEQAIDPAVWSLNEYDLLVLNTTDIRAQMIARAPALGGGVPVPGITEVDALRELARNRLGARQQAMGNLMVDRQRRASVLQRERREIETEGYAVGELTSIKRAAERYSDIRDRVTRMTDDQLRDFFNPADASTQPGRYTPDQQRYSIFFNNAAELLFDNPNETQARYGGEAGTNAAFNRNLLVLNEDQLLAEMIRVFNIPIVLGAPAAGNRAIVCDYMRESFGLTPGINATRSKGDLARFFTRNMIFDHLAPQVRRF